MVCCVLLALFQREWDFAHRAHSTQNLFRQMEAKLKSGLFSFCCWKFCEKGKRSPNCTQPPSSWSLHCLAIPQSLSETNKSTFFIHLGDKGCREVQSSSSSWSAAAAAKSLQSCLTLCNPIDGSPPGSAVHGILQARTLEWVATSFSSAWAPLNSDGVYELPPFWGLFFCITSPLPWLATNLAQVPLLSGASSGACLPRWLNSALKVNTLGLSLHGLQRHTKNVFFF